MTDDLISRQAAIDVLGVFTQADALGHTPKQIVEALPSVQPEMVKCKKCRYVYYDKEFGNYWCDRMSDSFKVEADGYCKWGK